MIEGFWRLFETPLLPGLLLLVPSLEIGHLLLAGDHRRDDFLHFFIEDRGLLGLHLKI